MQKYFLISILSLFLLGPILVVQAVTTNWQLTNNKTVLLILNTQNQKINTVEGEISFDSSQLKLKNISDANSLVNLWIERPQIKQNKISFSGLIPNGYTGQGFVLALTFSTDKNLTTANLPSLIRLNYFNALLHDGLGQKAVVEIGGLIDQNKANVNLSLLDNKIIKAPENFKPQIIKSSSLPTDNYYLIFNTQDKTAGLAYYAVYESNWPVFNLAKQNLKLNWIRAESPYLLKNQSLNHYLYIKAVNYAGGVRFTRLSPQFSFGWWCERWPLSSIIKLIYGSS